MSNIIPLSLAREQVQLLPLQYAARSLACYRLCLLRQALQLVHLLTMHHQDEVFAHCCLHSRQCDTHFCVQTLLSACLECQHLMFIAQLTQQLPEGRDSTTGSGAAGAASAGFAASLGLCSNTGNRLL